MYLIHSFHWHLWNLNDTLIMTLLGSLCLVRGLSTLSVRWKACCYKTKQKQLQKDISQYPDIMTPVWLRFNIIPLRLVEFLLYMSARWYSEEKYRPWGVRVEIFLPQSFSFSLWNMTQCHLLRKMMSAGKLGLKEKWIIPFKKVRWWTFVKDQRIALRVSLCWGDQKYVVTATYDFLQQYSVHSHGAEKVVLHLAKVRTWKADTTRGNKAQTGE